MIINAWDRLIYENKKASVRLSSDACMKIKDMVEYARGKGVGLYESEVLRKDLIGMWAEANARGEPMAETLGMEERAFCDEVAANSPRRPGETLLYMFYTASWNVLLFSLLTALLAGFGALQVGLSTLLWLAFLLAMSLWHGYYDRRFAYFKGRRMLLIGLVGLPLILVYVFGVRYARAFPVWFSVHWSVPVVIALAVFIGLRIAWSACVNRLAGPAGEQAE